MSFLARVTYTGNGSTTGYAIPFSYIATTHIQAFIDNVQTTAFTVTDAASGTIGSQSNGISYTPNRFGTGVWEECAASNLEIKFDKEFT